VRVEQIVANLVSNALKYSPGRCPVEVRVDVEEDVAVTSVTDRGPGIADADRQRVFERFYRVESAVRSKTKGVGLGLFIARSLVDAMGGELTLRSRPGEGSTFAFTLPLLPATSGARRRVLAEAGVVSVAG
jgi:signal transduction histidine kinase